MPHPGDDGSQAPDIGCHGLGVRASNGAEDRIVEPEMTSSSALPLPRDGSAESGGFGGLRALRGGGAGAGERARVQADAPDVELLAAAQAGDREAFGALVQRHHGLLHGLLRQRLGACGPVEDLLQDVFTKALGKLDGFGGRSSFSTWAGAIAINLATDWQRKQARRRRLAPTDGTGSDEVAAPRSADGLSIVETRDEAARARAAMESLPLHVRTAVTLRVMEDHGYDVIAARLGAPVPTIRTWVSRGLKQVRRLLEDSDA